MQKNKIKNQTGTSLIEMMLAISIFIVLGSLTLGIFKSATESQKSVIAGQNTQENLRYLFEVMSKELRSAVIMEGDCNGVLGIAATKEIFNVDGGGNELYFKNKDDECVAYFINGSGELEILRDGGTATSLPVTPNDILVTDLDFIVTDNNINALPGSKIQPRVTMKIEVEANNSGVHKQHTVMQTTISSRHYE